MRFCQEDSLVLRVESKNIQDVTVLGSVVGLLHLQRDECRSPGRTTTPVVGDREDEGPRVLKGGVEDARFSVCGEPPLKL